jgi:hypothetical protein
MKSLERWKHCVVNVEFGQSDGETKDRQAGTAFFIIYKKKYFLVTAAHLIIDKKVGSDKPVYAQIFRQMLRVPLLSELNDENKRKIITKNFYFDEKGQLFQQKTPKGIPYQHNGEDIAAPKFIQLSESIESEYAAVTISEENDIAIISLRGRLGEIFTKMFWNEPILVEELLLLGYQPISIDELGQEPSQEGAEIITVGYPSHISRVDKRNEIIGKYEMFFSTDVTLPCFTFGKISMVSPDLPFFWGDLRVYIGNSGCPVIEDEKIVGIVTHDAVIEENNKLNNVPFAKATKAKFIPDMLEEQMKKDEKFIDPTTLHKRYPNMFASPEEIAETKKKLKLHKRKKTFTDRSKNS